MSEHSTQISDQQIVIIGAGPAGLTAAYELVKRGQRPVVIEKDPHYVGGIARTIEYHGFRFDIGGHRFFSKSREIETLWEEICGEDFLRRPRKSRIFYRGRFFDYPLRAGNAFRGLGPLEAARCLASFAKSRLFRIRPERSFEDWVVNRFGRRLYEIFFRTYTEKVWGVPCRTISADWASQRIKGLSLWSALVHALFPRRPRSNATAVKTLIDSFRYPRLGPGMMWELCRDRITARGGRVIMGRSVTAIRHDTKKVLEIETESVSGGPAILRGSHFLSSMPLRELMECWDPAPPPQVLKAARALTYRDFILVALIVRASQISGDNWIYVHSPGVKVGRIQNFRAWSEDMVPRGDRSCLGLEYFCTEGDALWTTPNDDLVALAGAELEQMGLVRPGDVEDGCVVRMAKTYPVYDDHYQRHVLTIRGYLEQFPNIQVVGRNGMHKYNNQDHSMMTALLAARNILGARYDVWSVNTDAEYLEEDKSSAPAGRLAPFPLQPALEQQD